MTVVSGGRRRRNRARSQVKSSTPPSGTGDSAVEPGVDLSAQVASPPWGLTVKAIVASAGLVVAALVVWRFNFLLSTLALAAVLAYLLNPPVRWLKRKTGIRRSQAVLIVYVLVLMVVGAVGALIALTVAERSARLWGSLPDLLPRLVQEIAQRGRAFGEVSWSIGPYTLEFSALLELVDWDEIVREVRTGVQTLAGRSGLWLAGLAQATLGTLGETFLVLVLSIYFAIDGPRMGEVIGELAHQPGYRQDADRLLQETVKIWDTYLRGQVILGVVIFLVVGVSLGVLGVSNALELGILSGVLEFLPVIGPVIGTGAAVLVALFQNSNPWGVSPWVFALIVLGVMTVIQQLENAVLVPRIVGDALDLHPIVVMVGVIMGASLAGLLGAVLAAPVLASLKLYGTYVWRKLLDLPPFVDETPEAEEASDGGLWSGLLDRVLGKLSASDKGGR